MRGKLNPLFNHIPFLTTHTHYPIPILLANLFTLRFHHYTHNRFRSGFTYQDPASIAQFLCNLLHRSLHICIILRSLLIGHSHDCEHLWINGKSICQFAELFLSRHHNFHNLQTGKDSVPSAGVFAENNVTALLTADATAVFHHVLIYIFVSNGCFRVVDSKLITGLVQTEVGHDGGDNCIGQQLAALFHVFSVDVQNVVTCDHIALLIHTKTTVRITIIGKTHVQSILHHIFLQSLNMGRSGIVVDVGAIRLGVDHVGFGAESIKNSLGNVPGASVGTVQRHLHAAEGIDPQRDQIPYVTVSSGNIVYCTADFFLLCKRNLLPLIPEDFQISI